ncbi:PorT family protein [Hymenobacter sp. RP-2-7]|uniref:PorT family protein n=1 Tax=Hymenobacter polaris TaxID=2682546 RepID=A0A7Y0FN95_9BACT|nr:porin family protein [Hymenobacter polaris]NML66239.1 PorT family protein [Hymenobacter polaris]
MRPSFTLMAGLLALAARPAQAQFIRAYLPPDEQAQQNQLNVARPHRLLVNIKAGFSLTTYTGGGYIGWRTGLTTGYSAGLAGAVRLARRWAAQAEVLYAGKGVQYDTYWYRGGSNWPTSQPFDNVYEAALHYVDLPLLLSYGPGSGSRPGWFVVAGPQLSLAFDKQETVRPGSVSNADDYRETLNGDAKSLTRWGRGYVVGLGIQAQPSGVVGVELRYSGDFSNVYRDGYGSGALFAGSSNRFHNGALMLQVNIGLRGGKVQRGGLPIESGPGEFPPPPSQQVAPGRSLAPVPRPQPAKPVGN